MIAWLPAVLLVVTLLCTFAPWVGMYVGGYPAYSQGPWSAMFGSPNPNPPLVATMQTLGNWHDHFNSDWELMVPFLLVLILATVLALADRGFHSLDPRRIPPLAGIWKWRKLAILLFAAAAFALAFSQVLHGFGLERAIRKTVAEKYAPERAEAKGNAVKLAQVQYREDQEFAKYNLERTTWLYVALVCNLLAVFAMLAHTAARTPRRQATTKIGAAILGERPGVSGPSLALTDSVRLRRTVRLPPRRFFSIQSQCQAFGAPPGLEELIELDFDGPVAGLGQARGQMGAAAVVDDGLAHHHRVATEAERLGLVDGDEPRDLGLENALAVGIEGAGEVEGFARRERAEAGIEVIEARVHEFQGQHAHAEAFADPLMAEASERVR